MHPTEYHLTLTPTGNNRRVPPEARLRAALKRLLRNYGLRCTRCTPAPEPKEITKP